MASMPKIERDPLEGGINVVSSLIVVDFPAPLGPKNPKTWPDFIDKTSPSTALTEPYDFDRWSTSIQDITKLRSSH